ncbi:chromosome-associated kinesin KIF4-like [Vespa mandarinia]|uniref:chromosome-associated kinesin KIF4-like n=1 Tax=Vespa mandarinia TaxID=7446 RepID=UPI001610346F|nr:chromosome-associated kinesin KIF4-like [Vespa mandarinia]XP_035733122.1 chromosome-associated kinesin KIF4-like [Vespa mandarinia]
MVEDTIRVAVRIRPLIKSEIEKGCEECLDTTPGQPQIIIKNTDRAFTFNYVFAPDVNQENFYNTAIKEMVTRIFDGYNVTILAYGQTGSGKTHSMGTDYSGVEDMGIIPRAMQDIFKIVASKKEWNFRTSVSFMELYQEQLYDLLSDKQRTHSTVDIREDNKGIRIIGVTEKEVQNAEECLECLIEGSQGRVTGSTAMNAQSSRSHAIFTLHIQQQKGNDPNTATTAKFHLVDLAGSERSKKTQATGERFKEGVHINKGLLALGNVISQLGDGGNNSYVGYRDSKLTRLLQDSLGGNSMTLMIACVSPADYNMDETLSTLRYADRARKIKNKPVVNQDPRVAEINRLNELVQKLKLALLHKESQQSCSSDCQELQKKNELLQQKIRDLTEQLNGNLIKMVFMHEKTELAEQLHDKIKAEMALVLEDCKELLDSFSESSTHNDEHYVKLKVIYQKILDIQTNEKKTSEEIFNHAMSLELKSPIIKDNENDVDNAASDGELTNCLEDFDKKHEEHTLLQTERNNQVQDINRELAIKEHLISELLKNSSHMIEYSKELQDMEQEIKTLQAEKDELLVALRNAQANNVGSKLAESRRKKVQELEKKITELTQKCLEQSKTLKAKEKLQQQIKNLTNEIQSLKQTRVKLVRQMRSDADRFAEWKRTREKELNKLKELDRKRANQMARLQMQHDKQQNVFKRKMEEAYAANKRLKEALEVQKKAKERREKTFNNKNDIQSWVRQELEILLSTVDAENSLQKLISDRNFLKSQLEELKNDSNVDETELVELTEFLTLRSTQIQDLQQKINEANEENRANIRINTIQTMADAKVAIKFLFDVTAEDRKKLMEKYTNLQTNLDECRQREEKLKQEIETYKDQLNQPERKVLKENNSRTNNETSSIMSTPKVQKISSTYYENSFISDDSFVEDDVEKDPDWTRTPLYNKIQKLLDTTKNPRQSIKRSSDGEVKCACKTKCITRLCSCRKNDRICNNCQCNPDLCQNNDINKLIHSYFRDYAEDNQDENSIKKPRLVK